MIMARVDTRDPAREASRPAVVDWRTALYFSLHFAGFLATSLLTTWGLFALFFLALGSFSLDGFMAQMGNLSSRYLIATSDRVASFKTIFAVAQVILMAGVIVLRRHAIMPPAKLQGAPRHG